MKQYNGFEIIHFGTLASTNDTALEYSRCAGGEKKVIWADKQTAGRGRRGRVWQSLDGNLFFSLLLEFPLKDLGKLVLAASLALAETVKYLQPEADVKLKWPNDLLLNGAKVSGMLLEKGENDYMIVGIGVNVKQSPDAKDILYPAISLRAVGIEITAEQFLNLYIEKFAKTVQLSAHKLREKWLQYALGLGKMIAVRQESVTEEGVFVGLDDNADLLLQVGAEIRKIYAGDVFLVKEEK